MFDESNKRLPNDFFIFEGLSSFVVRNRDFIDMFVISYSFSGDLFTKRAETRSLCTT